MRTIVVILDTLHRRYLPPYGCDWVHAPNFQRLAERSVTFDRAYVGSMPCMPARRELHTARHNFLLRDWGPLEPFDDSMPEMLKQAGVHSHLVTDNFPYFCNGTLNYHCRFATWEFIRGFWTDPWKANLTDDVDMHPESGNNRIGNAGAGVLEQDWVNRHYMPEEKDHYIARTFNTALEFLETNHQEDNWYLQLDEFAPHEPFFTPQRFKDLYPHDWTEAVWDMQPSGGRSSADDPVEHFHYECAASVSMCDEYLGKVLAFMDEHAMWDDTMLIVTTDHGNEEAEHGWWGKCVMPYYNTIAHIPLFIWDPRSGCKGERRQSLVQWIDLVPTILKANGLAPTADMSGHDLADTIQRDTSVREACIYGHHSGHMNVTDGRYVYMRAPVRPDGQPRYSYTLMPVHLNKPFAEPFDGVGSVEMVGPLAFTKGMQIMKIPSRHDFGTPYDHGTLLFDLENDPEQMNPLDAPEIEARMVGLLDRALHEHDAPPEQWERLGIPRGDRGLPEPRMDEWGKGVA